jgi:hypothetical protein
LWGGLASPNRYCSGGLGGDVTRNRLWACRTAYGSTLRRRRGLAMTENEQIVMAALAFIWLSTLMNG